MSIITIAMEFDFDPRFIHPFSILLAGPSGSGKTYFAMKLLSERCSVQYKKIIWYYAEWQPCYEAAPNNIQFIPGMPTSLDDAIDNVSGPRAVVFDDMMSKCADSELVAEAFTQKRHHQDLTVVLILQNLFVQGKVMRNIHLNSQYMVLFNNPRDRGQFNCFARQIEAGNSKSLVSSYIDATKEKFGHFLIDLKPGTPDILKYRSDTLDDIQNVYVIHN